MYQANRAGRDGAFTNFSRSCAESHSRRSKPRRKQH